MTMARALEEVEGRIKDINRKVQIADASG